MLPVEVTVPRHLGDAVMALPALRLLARGLPDRPLIVRVDAPGDAALAGQGTFVVAADRGAPRGAGPAILLSDSLRPAWASFVARAQPRVGRATDGRRRLLSHPVPGEGALLPGRSPHGRRLPALLVREHQVDAFLRVARHALGVLGAPAHPRAGDDTLTLLAGAEAEAQRAYAAVGAPEVLLHPYAAGARTKRWPLDLWIEVGRGLGDEGRRLCVSAGPDREDAALAEALAGALAAPCLSGATMLPILVWAAFARRVDAVVVPDTGLGHVARAAGASVVSIFTSTDPARHAPRGPGFATVLRGDAGLVCAPCYGDRCHGPSPLRCATSVLARDVAREVGAARRSEVRP